MRIVVTGAAGFVGRPLCAALLAKGYEVIPVVRSRQQAIKGIPFSQHIFLPICNALTEWDAFFADTDVFIHLMAHTHKPEDNSINNPFQQVNVDAFKPMIEAACRCQVKQIVFLSSIKVNGESTTHQPFHVGSEPQPEDDYGHSKYQAEQLLIRLTQKTSTQYTILRPPLVFGAKPKGNLQQLTALANKQWPLPLGGINNKRSLISIDNLVDVVQVCLLNPKAFAQTFLVADEGTVSTSRLVTLLSQHANRCFTVPRWLLTAFLFICNKKTSINKLLGNLEIDISHAVTTLDWKPSLTTEEGFEKLRKGTEGDL